MMVKVYKFFADTMVVGGRAAQSPNCSAAAVASCSSARVAVTTAPPPPPPPPPPPSPPPSPPPPATPADAPPSLPSTLSEGEGDADSVADGGAESYSGSCANDGDADCWYAQTACAAPAQSDWLGSISSDASNIESAEGWATLYWALCLFESYCPAPGISCAPSCRLVGPNTTPHRSPDRVGSRSLTDASLDHPIDCSLSLSLELARSLERPQQISARCSLRPRNLLHSHAFAPAPMHARRNTHRNTCTGRTR